MWKWLCTLKFWVRNSNSPIFKKLIIITFFGKKEDAFLKKEREIKLEVREREGKNLGEEGGEGRDEGKLDQGQTWDLKNNVLYF